MDPKVETY